MITQTALLPGDSEIDQLYKIFQLLGTPSEETWEGISSYSFYKDSFPIWKGNLLSSVVEGIDEDGLDLLQKMLVLEPKKRISAKEALKHSFFDDLEKSYF
jgi:serine/threonine protein kinase